MGSRRTPVRGGQAGPALRGVSDGGDGGEDEGPVWSYSPASRSYLLNVRPEASSSSSRLSPPSSGRSTFCSIIAQLTEETQPLFETTLKSRSVSEDCDAKFTCVVIGYPKPEVTWYRDDEELDRYCGLPKYEISQRGNRHTLQLYKCREEDAAIYQASARNTKGIVSCSGVLEVGTMTEYKIHQRWFAKLKRKAEAKLREIEQSRKRGKEAAPDAWDGVAPEDGAPRKLSPDRFQRKRRLRGAAEPDSPPGSGGDDERGSRGPDPVAKSGDSGLAGGSLVGDQVATNGDATLDSGEEGGREAGGIRAHRPLKESVAKKKKKEEEEKEPGRRAGTRPGEQKQPQAPASGSPGPAESRHLPTPPAPGSLRGLEPRRAKPPEVPEARSTHPRGVGVRDSPTPTPTPPGNSYFSLKDLFLESCQPPTNAEDSGMPTGMKGGGPPAAQPPRGFNKKRFEPPKPKGDLSREPPSRPPPRQGAQEPPAPPVPLAPRAPARRRHGARESPSLERPAPSASREGHPCIISVPFPGFCGSQQAMSVGERQEQNLGVQRACRRRIEAVLDCKKWTKGEGGNRENSDSMDTDAHLDGRIQANRRPHSDPKQGGTRAQVDKKSQVGTRMQADEKPQTDVRTQEEVRTQVDEKPKMDTRMQEDTRMQVEKKPPVNLRTQEDTKRQMDEKPSVDGRTQEDMRTQVDEKPPVDRRTQEDMKTQAHKADTSTRDGTPQSDVKQAEGRPQADEKPHKNPKARSEGESFTNSQGRAPGFPGSGVPGSPLSPGHFPECPSPDSAPTRPIVAENPAPNSFEGDSLDRPAGISVRPALPFSAGQMDPAQSQLAEGRPPQPTPGVSLVAGGRELSLTGEVGRPPSSDTHLSALGPEPLKSEEGLGPGHPTPMDLASHQPPEACAQGGSALPQLQGPGSPAPEEGGQCQGSPRAPESKEADSCLIDSLKNYLLLLLKLSSAGPPDSYQGGSQVGARPEGLQTPAPGPPAPQHSLCPTVEVAGLSPRTSRRILERVENNHLVQSAETLCLSPRTSRRLTGLLHQELQAGHQALALGRGSGRGPAPLTIPDIVVGEEAPPQDLEREDLASSGEGGVWEVPGEGEELGPFLEKERETPDVGESREQEIPGAGESKEKEVPEVGESKEKEVPGDGKSKEKEAPGAGESREQESPGVGESGEQKAPGAGEKGELEEGRLEVPGATPEELALGARRKRFLPRAKPAGELEAEEKEKGSPSTSPRGTRKSQAPGSSPAPAAPGRSPTQNRKLVTLEVPRAFEEPAGPGGDGDGPEGGRAPDTEPAPGGPEHGQDAPEAEPKKTKDPFKAPQVIRKIRVEQFPDASGSLKLWCQFFNILGDSVLTWTKDSRPVAEVARSAGDEGPAALAIVQASPQDCGLYRCSIRNEHGADSTDFRLSPDVLAGLVSREEAEVGEEIEMTPMVFAKGLADSGCWGDKLFGRLVSGELCGGGAGGGLRKASRAKVIYGLEPIFESGRTCVIKVPSPLVFGPGSDSSLLGRNYDATIQGCKIQNMSREYCKIFAAEARAAPAFGQVPEIIPLYLIYRPANTIPYATLEEDLGAPLAPYCARESGSQEGPEGSEAALKCQTFQHWLYEWTNGGFLVTDLAGVGWKTTNVQIATRLRGYQGLKESCSPALLDQFESTHQCSPHCRMLGLQPLRGPESAHSLAKSRGPKSPSQGRRGQSTQSSPQLQKKGLASPQGSRKSGLSPKAARKASEAAGRPDPPDDRGAEAQGLR
ncbi:alpha-protein kinase 3 [Tachyglossus aculeatus]|uniref:alpha-protein kinase 3 n=1 Tax=Tachyglossus aculeatus TaxID=9261 RepID=UPI0018F67EC2|nr:alpha-protein kinase 3 [Tachyglossus aculeatus]